MDELIKHCLQFTPPPIYCQISIYLYQFHIEHPYFTVLLRPLVLIKMIIAAHVRTAVSRFVISSVALDLCCIRPSCPLHYASYLKHRIPHSWEYRLPVSVHTHIRRHAANNKDPSTSVGMTNRTRIVSHPLSCRCVELCLFEALYPAPLARPFSKGLLVSLM